MCRFHLFCQAPLSVSERHPFHTCQDVFGLKIILRMFRVASRTLSREQRGEAEKETKDQENLCLASAENLFFVPVTAALIPPHRYSHGSRGTPRVPAPLHLSPFSPPDRDRRVDSPAWSGRGSGTCRRTSRGGQSHEEIRDEPRWWCHMAIAPGSPVRP